MLLPPWHFCMGSNANKWKMIGTALRFRPQDLDRIQADIGWKPDPSKQSLLQLFDMWIKRECKYTLPPTLRSLDQALNSELVGLGALACEVRVASPDIIDRTKALYQPLPLIVSSVMFEFQSGMIKSSYQCQNMQHIEASENQSISLKVQANSNEEKQIERLEYQWEADHLTASTSPILCITAGIDVDGRQYSCTVKYNYTTFSLFEFFLTRRFDASKVAATETVKTEA